MEKYIVFVRKTLTSQHYSICGQNLKSSAKVEQYGRAFWNIVNVLLSNIEIYMIKVMKINRLEA